MNKSSFFTTFIFENVNSLIINYNMAEKLILTNKERKKSGFRFESVN